MLWCDIDHSGQSYAGRSLEKSKPFSVLQRGDITICLLQIDQPGSAIDAYIGGLRDVLERKASNIAQLQGRLENFQVRSAAQTFRDWLVSQRMHVIEFYI